MSSETKTPLFLTLTCFGGLLLSSLVPRYISDENFQDPDDERKRVVSEGYALGNKLYSFVDKDKNRILTAVEKRSLLDLLGFDKKFLDESNPVSIRPTKDGDGRLNIYFTEGFDGYVGTIPYSKAEEVISKKK